MCENPLTESNVQNVTMTLQLTDMPLNVISRQHSLAISSAVCIMGMTIFAGVLYKVIDTGFQDVGENENEFMPSDVVFMYVKAARVWLF